MIEYFDRLPSHVQRYILQLALMDADVRIVHQIKGDYAQWNTKGSYLGQHYTTHFHELSVPDDPEKNHLELVWRVSADDQNYSWGELEMHKVLVLGGNGRTIRHRKGKVDDADYEYRITVRLSMEQMLSRGKTFVKYWFHSPFCICFNGLFRETPYFRFDLTETWSYPKSLTVP